MFEKIREWFKRRRLEREAIEINNARMEAVVQAAWASGRPIIGTTDDAGNFTIKYAETEDKDAS